MGSDVQCTNHKVLLVTHIVGRAGAMGRPLERQPWQMWVWGDADRAPEPLRDVRMDSIPKPQKSKPA